MPYNPAHQADVERDKCRCMITGCLCCYDAYDCNNILLVSKSAGDCLCLRSSCCCAINSPPKGVGCTGDKNRGEFCKLALFCCDCAIVMPTKLCAYGTQFLCWYSVGSCPCSKEYVPMPVCTMFCPFLQVTPKCGCCVAPPPCPALDKVLRDGEQAPLKLVMDRSGHPPPPGSTVVVYPPGTTPVMYAAGAAGTAAPPMVMGGAAPPPVVVSSPPPMSQSAPPRIVSPTAPPSTADTDASGGKKKSSEPKVEGDDDDDDDDEEEEEEEDTGNDFESVEC